MPVTLRFVTGPGLVWSIIRRSEMGLWAGHVEALMPDGTLLGAHQDGGVQARPRYYDKGQWTQEAFVTLPATAKQQTAFEAFLRLQIGKPYDMGAVEEMAIGELTGEAPSWPESPAWICSALVMAALLTAGLIKAAPATVRLATPRDVLVGCGFLVSIDDPETPEGLTCRSKFSRIP